MTQSGTNIAATQKRAESSGNLAIPAVEGTPKEAVEAAERAVQRATQELLDAQSRLRTAVSSYTQHLTDPNRRQS